MPLSVLALKTLHKETWTPTPTFLPRKLAAGQQPRSREILKDPTYPLQNSRFGRNVRRTNHVNLATLTRLVVKWYGRGHEFVMMQKHVDHIATRVDKLAQSGCGEEVAKLQRLMGLLHRAILPLEERKGSWAEMAAEHSSVILALLRFAKHRAAMACTVAYRHAMAADGQAGADALAQAHKRLKLCRAASEHLFVDLLRPRTKVEAGAADGRDELGGRANDMLAAIGTFARTSFRAMHGDDFDWAATVYALCDAPDEGSRVRRAFRPDGIDPCTKGWAEGLHCRTVGARKLAFFNRRRHARLPPSPLHPTRPKAACWVKRKASAR